MYIKLLPEDKPSSQDKADKLGKLLTYIISAALSISAMLFTARWIIPAAAQERGYAGALGGEILAIAFVGISVFFLINWITKEDKHNVR